MNFLNNTIILIAFSTVQSFCAIGQWPQREFAIIGSDEPITVNQDYMQKYKEADFNIAQGITYDATIRKSFLDICGVIGIKSFFKFYHFRRPWSGITECGGPQSDLDCDANNQINNIIGTNLTAAQRNQIYGFWLEDEPRKSGALLAKPLDNYTIDDVLEFAAAIRKYDASAVTYFNLLPFNGNKDETGFSNWSEYQSYVAQAFTNPNTSIISVDHYAFSNNNLLGSSNKTIPNSYGTSSVHFFQTLSLFAKLASENSKSFWWYVNSEDQPPNYRIDHEITQNKMRFSVNAGLMYGAKGIIYFCYNTPLIGNPAYLQGFLNPAGTPTNIYTWGQSINQSTTNLGKELIRLKWQEAIHKSANDLTMTESGLATLPSTTCSLSDIASTSAAQFGVGVFKRGTTEYFLALNKDITNTQNVTLKFKSKKPFSVYNATTGVWQQQSALADQISLNGIEPGGVTLVRFGALDMSPILNLLLGD